MARQHNVNLDILRGIAAVVVVLHHLVSYDNGFDSRYSIDVLLHYNFPAHLCVIVFFILSGYVIGLNHPVMSGGSEIRSYIRKRLIRILPIYFIAVIYAVAISGKNYSLSTVFSNLFLVSVPLDNVIIEDAPLWSLNYELIYYFVFILFAYGNVNLKKTLGAMLAAIAVIFAFFHNVRIHPLLISYFVGFIFWIAGAMIAKAGKWPVWKVSHARMLAVFLLIFCMQQFNPYGPILKVLHISTVDYSALTFFQQSISYNDLFFFPATFLLIMSLNRAWSKYNKALYYFTILCCTLRLVMLFKVYGAGYVVKEHYVIPMAVLAASILLWFGNFSFGRRSLSAIKSTSGLSRVSYALYIIHLPTLFLFYRIQVTSGFLFALKLLAYFIAVFALAYLLEEKYQPFVKGLLRRKKAVAIEQ